MGNADAVGAVAGTVAGVFAKATVDESCGSVDDDASVRWLFGVCGFEPGARAFDPVEAGSESRDAVRCLAACSWRSKCAGAAGFCAPPAGVLRGGGTEAGVEPTAWAVMTWSLL